MDPKLQELINALNAAEKLAKVVEAAYPDSGEVEYAVKYLPDMIAGLCELRDYMEQP